MWPKAGEASAWPRVVTVDITEMVFTKATPLGTRLSFPVFLAIRCCPLANPRDRRSCAHFKSPPCHPLGSFSFCGLKVNTQADLGGVQRKTAEPP